MPRAAVIALMMIITLLIVAFSAICAHRSRIASTAAALSAFAFLAFSASLSSPELASLAADDFFAGDERRALKSETMIDALRGKFGAGAVVSGRALKGK